MPLLETTTTINAPLEEVFSFFSDPENLAVLTPANMRFEILSAPRRPLVAGDLIDYRIRIFGLPVKWRTRITRWEKNRAFADLQEKGPYRLWLHTHTFTAAADGVEMQDRVEYELPLGLIGGLFAGWFVRRELRTIFAFRSEAIQRRFGPRRLGG